MVKGCVDGPLKGHPEPRAVEPNVAVFATVGWKEGGDLTYANIAVLKTQASLEEYYYDPKDGAFYLRLDFDYGTLGPAFTHALPHVHNSSDDTAPRFAPDGLNSENVVMDFFEYVYRHLLPDRWLAWARAVWHRAHKTLPPEENPFETMITAFKESKIEVLRAHAAPIATLKRLLREEKDCRYRPRANRSDMDLLRYPL